MKAPQIARWRNRPRVVGARGVIRVHPERVVVADTPAVMADVVVCDLCVEPKSLAKLVADHLPQLRDSVWSDSAVREHPVFCGASLTCTDVNLARLASAWSPSNC